MKKMKKMMCLLLAAVMVFSVGFAVNGKEAKAAEAENKMPVPKAVRCGVGAYNDNYVSIPLAKNTSTVKNIKVYKGKKKTKNLVVKKVYTSRSEVEPYAEYRLYAKKSGKYTIKYNVYTDGKKGKTQQIKVRAQGYGNSIESVTINKKNIRKYIADYSPNYTYYTTKDKVKVKFKAAKGCKIKKIEMTYYDKNGKEVTKKIKNGKKVTLGKYAYSRSSSYSSAKDMWAYTTFKVTYKDSYDKNNEDPTYEVKIAKKAKAWYKEANTDE